MSPKERQRRITRGYCWTTVGLAVFWILAWASWGFSVPNGIITPGMGLVALTTVSGLTVLIGAAGLVLALRSLVPIELALSLLYAVIWQFTSLVTSAEYRIAPQLISCFSAAGVLAWFFWKTTTPDTPAGLRS